MKSTTNKRNFWIKYYLFTAIFCLAIAMKMKYEQTGVAWSTNIIVPFGSLVTMALAFGYLAMYLIKRMSKLSHDKLNKRIVPVFILFLISVYLIAQLSIFVWVFFAYVAKGYDLNTLIPNFFKYEIADSKTSLFVPMLFTSIAFFYVLWNKSVKKEQKLREEKLKYQYQTLKSQVNPHFLFNSFNTLSELIYEDSKKADNYLQELSLIYRYVIDNEDKKLIALKDELTFVDRYFKLQQVRNGDKILLSVKINNSDMIEVVPVSIQSLVENAIKHNSANLESPLKITIEIENDYIVIRNNLQRKSTLESTTQKGLNNLKEQYKLVMDNSIEISENSTEFIVKLPIHEV